MILFVALVVFAVGVTSITLRVDQLATTTQRQQDELVLWRYETNRVSLAAEELRTNLAEMNESLLTGDTESAAADMTLAETNIRFIESDLSTISALNLPADSVADNTQAAVAFRALTDTARKFISAVPISNQDGMILLDGALLNARAAHIRVDTIITAKIQQNAQLIVTDKAASASATLIASIGAVVCLLLIAFYQFYLTLRPVKRLADVATKLASGEFVAIKPTRRRDELGQLTSALAAWQHSSQDLVDGLREGSSTAAASASNLASVSDQLAAATAEQTSATTATSVTMEELAGTASAIADMLALVASRTIETRENLERANVDTLASGSRAQAMAARVHDIHAILELINQVADQTNLLALNAAIEAARAGQAGLGFAVVADEVRRLAERSKSSAAQIAAIMANAEAESTATIEAMDRSAKQMQQSLSLLARVVEASGQVQVITQQQRTATEQVGEAISRITVGSRQVSDTARKISTAAAGNAALASEMEQMSRRTG